MDNNQNQSQNNNSNQSGYNNANNTQNTYSDPSFNNIGKGYYSDNNNNGNGYYNNGNGNQNYNNGNGNQNYNNGNSNQNYNNGNYNNNPYNNGANQNNYQQKAEPAPNFSTYLIISVVIAILGGKLLGVVSIVLLIIGNNDYKSGNMAGYEEKFKIAKILMIVGTVVAAFSFLDGFVFHIFKAFNKFNIYNWIW